MSQVPLYIISTSEGASLITYHSIDISQGQRSILKREGCLGALSPESQHYFRKSAETETIGQKRTGLSTNIFSVL